MNPIGIEAPPKHFVFRIGVQGQALMEFVLGFSLMLAVILGAAKIFKASWDRFRCAYSVFEITHDHLIGRKMFTAPPKGVTLEDFGSGISGEGRCDSAHEKVRLFRIEGTPG